MEQELGYTGDEYKAQICAFILKHLIKLTQHRAHFIKFFGLVNQSHYGRVVFIKNDNSFLASLFVCAVYQTGEAGARGILRFISAKVFFVF